jgi:L-ascorbate metabolism protein UlaG (beta-lactamase superfamily)
MNNYLKYIFFSMLVLLFGCGSANSKSVDGGDSYQTPSGKTVVIEPIKHGSLRISFDGKEIEIDPVTDAIKPVTDYSKKPKADFIFITHEHHDHLDKKAIEQLSKPGTEVIVNQRCHDLLGFGEVMRNGDSLDLGNGITVRAVPAYNTTPDHEKFHPKGRDNGYVISLDGFTVYIGADTEDIPEMKELNGIDVAFLPCNQPYTMTPNQLRSAVEMIHPKVVYPYHLGDTDRNQIEAALKDLDVEVKMQTAHNAD